MPDAVLPKPARKAAVVPAEGQGQAPAFVQGIKPLDPQEALANATPEQLRLLTFSNFALWAQYSGVEVDNREFEFDNHRYLLPIYLDNSKELVWMKSAQMGATIYEVLRLLWFCRYNVVKAGLYFPTQDGVLNLSKDRLGPLIESIPELKGAVHEAESKDALQLKHIKNVQGKLSSMYMLYLGGKASKDSVPLDILGFDEVRLCNPKDIDQAQERVSHSTFKYKMYVSTAGMPHTDIHARFLQGTQLYWHIRCNCTDGFVPSECFPDCIGVSGKDVFLRCPVCKFRVQDPQNGRYIAHNPGADVPSYHISQFISKFISVKEIWDSYNKTTHKTEFFNAKLGNPFVDVDNVPVTDAVLQNCINTDLRWAKDEGRHKGTYSMGIDQHAGNIYIVILKRAPDGKKQVVHLEIVERDNPLYWEGGEQVTPFKRAYQLMREFNIGMCVVDAMPNYNESTELARNFPGRIFVAWYGPEMQKDMAMWADRIKYKETIKRGSRQIKMKWQVSLNRYTSLDYTLSQFTKRSIELPHPDALVQVTRNKEGRFTAEAICREIFFTHLKGIVRHKEEIDPDTGKFKMMWKYLGIDPHFTHALNYATVAMERLSRQAIISF
jgi:hypothetical protein